MDKYHIYEEIGKGEFSQVFKGREKKKIEYVAIKRVEKSMMNTVVNEVQVMHKMDSPHALRFHDWYETRNNLWLILEYCTGSDLETLLRQDGHLPEQSVKTFGLDILAGLKYMHSMGILHCDIRPKNFLVDEYGILKISDFKMSRKVPKKPLGDMPLAERGTPEYMAPELFLPEGLHSYSSDFWSLGCILYELRRGQPPFGDENLPRDHLLSNIREREPVNDPLPRYRHRDPGAFIDLNRPGSGNSKSSKGSSKRGASSSASKSRGGRGRDDNDDDDDDRVPSMTAKLADLVLWLIEKQPQNRGSWAQISEHPFWGKKNVNEVPSHLPEENAYYNLVKSMEHEDHRAQEDSLMREFQLTRDQAMEIIKKSTSGQLAAGRGLSLAQHSTPAGKPERPHVSDSTPVRPLEKGAMHADRGDSRRVESIAEDSSPPQAPLEEDSQAVAAAVVDPGLVSESKMATPVVHRGGGSAGHGVTPARTPSSGGVGGDAKGLGTPAAQKGTLSAARDRDTPPPPATSGNRRDQPSGDLVAGAAPRATGAGAAAPAISGPVYAESLLVHRTDTAVKPIVGNRAIETIEKVAFKSSALPFSSPDVHELAKYSSDEIERHLTAIYKALQRAGNQENARANSRGASRGAEADGSGSDRTQMLGYLMSIAPNAEVANIVLNTNFVHLLLRLLRGGKSGVSSAGQSARPGSRDAGSRVDGGAAGSVSAGTRSVAVTILATVLRFATYVQSPTAKQRDEHILPTLVALMREDGAAGASSSRSTASNSRADAKTRRRCMAALGEVLFYISSQEVGEDDADDGLDGDDSSLRPNKWTVPPGTIGCVVKCLRDESDEALRHYAAKTIENILAQGSPEHKRKFVTVDIACRLLELSQHGRNEVMQACCGMALSHMFLFVMTLDPADKSASESTGGGAAKGSPGSTGRRPGTTGSGGRSGNGSGGKGAGASGGKELSSSTIPGMQTTAPGASSRFMLKVLDRGGLPAILETLNDGQPKLQQAYLNVINFLFASRERVVDWYNRGTKTTAGHDELDEGLVFDLGVSAGGVGRAATVGLSILDRGRTFAAGEEELRPVRAYFLRTPGLVPALVRLAEQGGSSAVRAKALLAAQLLGAHSTSLLSAFAEKRLPGVLVKLMDSQLSPKQDSESHQRRPASGGAGSSSNADYPVEAAISFVTFVREHSVRALQELQSQLGVLAAHDAKALFVDVDGVTHGAARGAGAELEPSTLDFGSSPSSSAGSPSKRRLGSAADRTRGESRSGPRGDAASAVVGSSPYTPVATAGNAARAPLNFQAMHSLLEVLRATSSMSSKPQIRRLIFVSSTQFLGSFALLLQDLQAARQHLHSLSSKASARENTDDSFLASARFTLDEVDKVVVVLLECLAQIDVQSHLDVASTRMDLGNSSDGENKESVALFARALSTLLATAAKTLTGHEDGAVRVIVAAVLRKCYPPTLVYLNATVDDPVIAQSLLGHTLSELFSVLPAMLQDGAPVPQYSLRLLTDLTALTGSNGAQSARHLHEALKREIASPSLVARLSTLFQNQFKLSEDGGAESGSSDGDRDAHSVLLLRAVCEMSTAACTRLLELNFAADLASAVSNVATPAMLPSSMASGEGLLDAPVLSVLVPLVDLSYFLLHFSFKAASAVAKRADDREASAELAVHSQRCRSLTAPLRSLCPTLLAVLAAPALREGNPARNDTRILTSSTDAGLMHLTGGDNVPQMRDTCSRALGIIFDLYPDSVTDAFLEGSAATSADATDTEFYAEVQRRGQAARGAKSAAELLSLALTYEGAPVQEPHSLSGASGRANADPGVSLRIRLLKILSGVSSLAGAMGVQEQVKRLLLSPPLIDALKTCADDGESSGAEVEAESKADSRPGSSAGTKVALAKHAKYVLMAAKQ